MTSVMQLVLFTLGLLLFGFGLFVGVYPEGDQTVGLLLMFGGLAQIIYSLGVNHVLRNENQTYFALEKERDEFREECRT